MEMEELTKRQETKLEMGGLTRLDVGTSEGQLRMSGLETKMREARLRWFEQQRGDGGYIRQRILKTELRVRRKRKTTEKIEDSWM